MTPYYATVALAEQRRQHLLSEATYSWQARAYRAQRGRRPSARPTRARRTLTRHMVAFQTWLAAGQL
jgi:hypothetical protein